ncbi:hypothetical protein HRH25_06795 [Flavisolibacter sp. BT320]|nr:hypothetical protein [Flavisolibacter longurius]
MTKTIYQECVEIVRDLVGFEPLYFESAVEVKLSPHTFPFAAWAVCVSPNDDLYVMDSDEQWHQAELSDFNAALVIGSLYQRLKLMRINYAKAS